MPFPTSWDEFVAAIRGEAPKQPDPKAEQPEPQKQLRPLVAATFVGDTAIRKELDEIKAEQQKTMDALAERAKADNRSACESWMKKGLFPASDLEKNIERRAQNASLFDEMMNERKPDPLASTAVVDGAEVVAKLDPTSQASIQTACKEFYKTTFAGQMKGA